MLTFASSIIVKTLDGYDITKSMRTSGKDIVVVYSPSMDGKPRVINSRNITFNTVFLLALIMAVPDIRRKLRLKILLLGVVFLFPVQVIRLSVSILNYYGQHMQKGEVYVYPVLWRKALFYGDMTLTRLDSMLVPVIIWAGLYFYYKWHRQFIPEKEPEISEQKSEGKKTKKKRDRR